MYLVSFLTLVSVALIYAHVFRLAQHVAETADCQIKNNERMAVVINQLHGTHDAILQLTKDQVSLDARQSALQKNFETLLGAIGQTADKGQK